MYKILFTLTLSMLSVLAMGQAPMLDGTVTCADNQPLDGVTIVVEHAVTFEADSTLTNPQEPYSSKLGSCGNPGSISDRVESGFRGRPHKDP